MPELKNCPFCGGKAHLKPQSICSGSIFCEQCHFETAKYWDNMCSHEPEKKWYDKVAEAWNRRTNNG